jgi:hypothetical protein
LAAASCTAVLGIHRAELEEDAGATPAGTTTGTTSSSGSGTTTGAGGSGAAAGCGVVAQDCSACLKTNCTVSMTACLGDSECRRSLDAYGKCLTASCVDTGNRCAEGNISNQDIALCTIQKCSSECGAGRLVSRCELYCACMKSSCGTDFGASLGGTDEKCLTACLALRTERDVDCRWSHCEYAALPNGASTHCPHAIAVPDDVCNVGITTKPTTCLTKKETGFPCQVPSECCTQSCRVGVCE